MIDYVLLFFLITDGIDKLCKYDKFSAVLLFLYWFPFINYYFLLLQLCLLFGR
jgi:hypothetical protein